MTSNSLVPGAPFQRLVYAQGWCGGCARNQNLTKRPTTYRRVNRSGVGMTVAVAPRLAIGTEPVSRRARGVTHTSIPSVQPLALIRAAGAVAIA